MPKKVLIFTDSRGQHIPKTDKHPGCTLSTILKSKYSANLDIDYFLCPFKWTTLVDFFECYHNQFSSKNYDQIFVYAGISDFLPRPVSSAINDIYNNPSGSTDYNLWHLSDASYESKCINIKKYWFDKLFGEKNILDFFANSSYDIEYRNERTINLYSLKMFHEYLLPSLVSIPNLVFINSNPIIHHWNGDYPRKRPDNIFLANEYSSHISTHFPSDRLIDLYKWNPGEVMKYTCDNMHLTGLGHIYLANQVSAHIDSIIYNPNHSAARQFIRLAHNSKLRHKFLASSSQKPKYTYPFLGYLQAPIEKLELIKVTPNTYNPWTCIASKDIFSSKESSSISELCSILHALSDTDTASLECKLLSSVTLSSFLEKRAAMKSSVDSILDKLCYTDNMFPWNYLSENFCADVARYSIDSRETNLSFSFIYCIKNRARRALISLMSLASSLNCFKKALGSQYVPIEVILVEDVSSSILDNSKLWNARLDIRHILVDTGVNWTRSGLLNVGLQSSKADICVFVDSDTLFPSDFIEKLFLVNKHFSLEEFVLPINMFETHPHCKDGVVHPQCTPYGYMWCVPREKALQVGGYNDSFTGWGSEDRDFEYRLRNHANLPIISSLSFSSLLYAFHLSHTTRTGVESREKNRKRYSLQKDIRRTDSDINKSLNIKVLRDSPINPAESIVETDASPLQADSRDILFVLGNGPSLKDVNLKLLKDYDVFCLNSMYRYFHELPFKPRYFGCFDKLVTRNHGDAFQDLLNDASNGIEKFFFLEEFNDPYDRLFYVRYSPDEFEEQKQRKYLSSCLEDFWIYENSGASAVHAGAAMGYKRIILLGVDCNYQQIVEGAAKHRKRQNELVVIDTPSNNPNYWKDDYQQAGDVYHVPDAHLYQQPEWERLAENWMASKSSDDLMIYNASSRSALNCFPRVPLCRLINPPNDIYEDLTFVVKSSGRASYLINLLNSLEKLSRNLRVLVLDDSPHRDEVESAILGLFSNRLEGLSFVSSASDVGLSAGRNSLLAVTQTSYFMLLDDDFVIGDSNALKQSVLHLMSTDLDIIGFSVFDIGPTALVKDQPRTFYGDIVLDSSTLKIVDTDPMVSKSSLGSGLCDLVMNCFVAKTSSVSSVMWDPELKLGEHLDFFIRAKMAGLRIAYHPGTEIYHYRDVESLDVQYREARGRANYYHEKFKEKYSIGTIIQHGRVIAG